MKKIFLIALAIPLLALAVYGMNLKSTLINRPGHPMTEKELCDNHCQQSITWMPFGTLWGMFLVLCPAGELAKFSLSLSLSGKQIDIVSLFILRIFGLLILVLTMYGIWNECKCFWV